MQLNRSLSVILVAQFQSYCRNLHDEAVAVHVTAATAGQQALLRVVLTQGRKLDSQNPRRAALGSDFGRLGLAFVHDMKAARPAVATELDYLEALIDFRNAIGHGEESEIAMIESGGSVRSTKASYMRSRRTLDRLAGTMDEVVSARLGALLGAPNPW
ncbi:MAG: hypothetical protein ACT4OS_00250 [Acidimicrobiales bacterium]